MKAHLFAIIFCICSIQFSYTQEDGVVSLALPVRNSLTYNQFAINPTFSFVREQNKYITAYNKREWTPFEDAPLTYLVSYSGRLKENIGVGIGVFQQNYGVLSTFGGLLNFAYNARISDDNNLTFGINVGAYSSGLNSGKVVTNIQDPSLDNIPSNFLVSVSPGINYGTTFLDFGVSANNLVLYNFNSSEVISENPEQGFQAHIMYTGYMDGSGFFDESKFSALIRSEFKKDNTVYSGLLMLTVPKGIWAQAGYNSLYGASGGLGIHITKQIGIEYSFEKPLGNFSEFGSSHEITLAYKFINKETFDYSGDDEMTALISTKKKRKPVSKTAKAEADANRELAEQAKLDRQNKADADAQAKIEAQNQAKLAADALAKVEADKQAKLTADALAKTEADNQARLAADALAKAEADKQAKLKADALAKAEAAKQAKLTADALAKAEADKQAKLAADAIAKAEADKQAKLAADALAKAEAAKQAKLAADAIAKAEADKQDKLAADALAKAEADKQAKLAADALAKAEADKQAKLEADALAKAEAEAEAEADKQAKLAAEANKNVMPSPTDAISQSMNNIAKQTENDKKAQNELLTRFSEVVAVKNKDLKDLKEENDLSEQGIFMEAKPFKSITAENKALEVIKIDLDNVIEARNEKINELEELYKRRYQADTINIDEVTLFFQKQLKTLKSEQLIALKTKSDLELKLKEIKVATEFERKRRIKRAAYDNEEDRAFKDQASLKVIKERTSISTTPLKEADFDFGEEQTDNIQILKNVPNVENGFYMIIAVHSDTVKRDDFLTKVVASGQSNINFFYDVNTSKYFIYYQKFDFVDQANNAMKSKGNKSYNGKMSIVKIEN